MPLTLRSKQSVPYNPNLAGRAGRYSEPNDDLPLNGAKTRAKRRQEQDHAERRTRIKASTVHKPPVTPMKDELLKLELATRGSNPTCLHFGIDTDARRARYPDYFCSNWDRWVL